MDEVYVGLDVSELNFGQIPANISRVTLRADGEHIYTAGDDSGRAIEKDCIFATQEMAEYVLSLVKDVEYQPYSGTDALLDPAAEIGDGITVCGIQSILAQSTIEFDKMCVANISAPTSDDLDDEYPYESAEKRNLNRLRDKLDRLASEVSKLSKKLENMGYMDGYVISFNGRDGKVVPQEEDYKEFIDKAIREAIGEGSGITGNCRLGDNIPDGCGEVHGLLHLDYTLVNCVTEKLVDFKNVIAGMCLCDDYWGYGPPACGDLHGLLHLDYTAVVDCIISETVLWGYDDASD